MPRPWSRYLKGVFEKLKYHAAWPPNQPRRLGDVGRLVHGEFQPQTSLELLGIKFAERVGPPGADISYTSGASVSVKLKAEGQSLPGTTIPQAKAGAVVEFSSSGAFVFQATAPVVREIDNQAGVGKEILTLYRKPGRQRGWEVDWCVVTELLTADRLTVLVSDSKDSKVELAANGKVPVGGPAPLASVNGSLSVIAQKGEVTSVLAEAGLSPLFRVSRIKRSLLDRLVGTDENIDFGRAAFRSGSMPNRVLENVSWDDAEDDSSKVSGVRAATVGRAKSVKKRVARDRKK